MHIEPQQNFKIKVDFSLSIMDELSLRLFYGPFLAGGLNIYETIYTFQSLQKTLYSFHFLCLFAKVDIYSLDSSFAKLEEYNLLRTFEAKDGSYLIYLQKPLYPSAFIQNIQYMESLKSSLSEDIFQQLMAAYPLFSENLSAYKEITRISLPQIINQEKDIKEEKKKAIPENLILYLEHVRPLIFPIQWRTKKVLSTLSVLQKTFAFDFKQLDILINKVVHRYADEEQMVSALYYFANKMDGNKLLLDEPYLSSPFAFYSNLRKRPINAFEKNILINYVKEMACSNEIINTIMEWSLSQIQDLNLTYLLKVGSTILNRHLDKRKDILNYLNNRQHKLKKERVIPQAKYMLETYNEKEDEQEIENFDIEDLKKRLEEGKF